MNYSGPSDSDTTSRGVRGGNAARNGTRVRGYRPRNTGGKNSYRGLLIVLGIAVVVVAAGLFLGMPLIRGFAVSLANGNPSAINFPFVGGFIRDDLGAALTQPAGTDGTDIAFEVADGQSVKQIGTNLADAKLVAKPLVFEYLVVTEGAGDKLQVGTFNLNQTMTPQQIVDRLQKTPDPKNPLVLVALRGRLRLEQIAAKLQTVGLRMDVNEWYQEALHPPADLIAAYPALSKLPEGRSLEGFLGLDQNYQVPRDATPDEFMRMLLDQWQKDIGQSVIDEADAKNKDFYDVLKLASIVERETENDSEKAEIAGVYANRLKGLLGNKLLNADPTLSYANDTMKLQDLKFTDWPQYLFWGTVDVPNLNLFQVSDDLSGYQTYVNQGLPPGPIDSPGKASIEAAINPDTSAGNVFFYACPGSQKDPTKQKHKFATTLAQQNKNIAKCQSSN